jgi:hypothetical protein
MQLTIDRKSFIEILAEGQGDVSGAMPPPPGGLWGLPPEILQTLPGYGPDVPGQPRRGPQIDGKSRLWARQAAPGQGGNAQHRSIP